MDPEEWNRLGYADLEVSNSSTKNSEQKEKYQQPSSPKRMRGGRDVVTEAQKRTITDFRMG